MIARLDFALCVVILTSLGPAALFAEEAWRKHVVHEGLHTNTAVAGDFSGDRKPDVISSSGGKVRLFVAPSGGR